LLDPRLLLASLYLLAQGDVRGHLFSCFVVEWDGDGIVQHEFLRPRQLKKRLLGGRGKKSFGLKLKVKNISMNL